MDIQFLIGFPASGKSTLAKKWAKEYAYNYIDLDAEIESNTGKKITTIFEEEGEIAFRKLEQAVLHEICQKLAENTILACGGGTPCFFDNHAFMQKIGKTIFINTPFETIVERLKTEKAHRPIVNQWDEKVWENKLHDLYQQRLPEYLKANEIMNNE